MPNRIEITIDVIIHATEDISKFYESFEEMFGLNKVSFSVRNLTGHFDNPIILLNSKLSKKNANNFLEKLKERLSKTQLDVLVGDIESRIDGSNLHIRFSKQEFIKNKLELDEKNAIKIRLYTPIYNKKEIVKTYTNLLTDAD